jgi:hypothetical protein
MHLGSRLFQTAEARQYLFSEVFGLKLTRAILWAPGYWSTGVLECWVSELECWSTSTDQWSILWLLSTLPNVRDLLWRSASHGADARSVGLRLLDRRISQPGVARNQAVVFARTIQTTAEYEHEDEDDWKNFARGGQCITKLTGSVNVPLAVGLNFQFAFTQREAALARIGGPNC